jgi:hypothetical protein
LTNPEADERSAKTPKSPSTDPPGSPAPPPAQDVILRRHDEGSETHGGVVQDPSQAQDDIAPPTAETPRAMPAMVEPVEPVAVVARPASPQEKEVLFVPLAVNIGDGFKFGCGFFLALVLVMLVGFVLVAALFVLTGLFGLSFPIAR